MCKMRNKKRRKMRDLGKKANDETERAQRGITNK